MPDHRSKDKKLYVAFVGGPDIGLRISFLKRLNKRGFRVAAIGTNEAERDLFDRENIRFITYGSSGGRLGIFLSLFALYRIFRIERFDIVHAFDTKPTITARVVAKLAGVPVIVGTITGMGKLFSDTGLASRLLSRVYMGFQTIAGRVSDMTIFQNRDDRDFFMSHHMVAVGRTSLIPGSGVDTMAFSPDMVDGHSLNALVEKFRMHGVPIVTMVSRLVKYKGIKEFLDSSGLVRKRHPNVIFLLVGPEDKSRDAFPSELISDFPGVKYLGPRSEIRELLYLSDVLMLPSYYREGVPRVILEAMSMGKPVVTTDMPGCRDAVEDGKNGFLVPAKNSHSLAEAVSTLLSDEALRKSMGKASRKKAENNFDINIIVDSTVQLYEELVRRKAVLAGAVRACPDHKI